MIGTHDGIFHADEVFAIAVLKGLAQYRDLEVARTRNLKKVDDCAVVVDVGNVYNHENGRFDHHQRGGAGERSNGIPYASFGLVWKHLGLRWTEENYPMVSDEDVTGLWERIDKRVVQAIDAHDCKFDLVGEWTTDIRPTTISNLISSLNPRWDEVDGEGEEEERFLYVIELAKVHFERTVDSMVAWLDAKAIVDAAAAQSVGGVVVLKRFVPWQEHLFSNKTDKASEALVVVFPGKPSGFRIQCVPDSSPDRKPRKPLPKAWGGLEPEDLQKVTGVETAMFCHRGLFVAGSEDLAGALKMAKLAV